MGKFFKHADGPQATDENEILEFLRFRFRIIAKLRVKGEDVEDIVQEACVTVIEKIRSGLEFDNFEASAVEILRNKIGNYYQHQKVQQKVMQKTPEPAFSRQIAYAGSENLLVKRLLSCMKKLVQMNRLYARVLNLSYQGYKTDEICSRMSIRREHLYVVLGRSRKLLKLCLGKDY